MANLTSQHSQGFFREYEFLKLLQVYLPPILGAELTVDPKIRTARPDFIATYPSGRQAIIEAKGVTPNTRARLDNVIKRLHRYSDLYEREYPSRERPELILAVPGT